VIAEVSAGGVADVSVGGFAVVGVVVEVSVLVDVGDVGGGDVVVSLESSEGVTVTFVPASACCSAARAAASGSTGCAGVSFPEESSELAAAGSGAGFGSGIGNGRVSGAEIGTSTPTLSSYVGRFWELLGGFGGPGRVTYAFATTGSVIVRCREGRAAAGTRPVEGTMGAV